MNSVRENSLWKWLNKAKYLYKKALHMCRVENLVLEGMGDVEGCLYRQQFWIELKCSTRPSSPETKIKVRFEEEQIPWLERRVAAGGKAFVLLQVGQGHKALRYLIRGSDAHKLVKGLTEKELFDLAVEDPDASAYDILGAAIA